MLVCSSVSFAAVANGSVSFNNNGGTITYSGGAGGVDTATTVNIPIPNGTTIFEQITGVNPTYLGQPNVFFSPGGLTPEPLGRDVVFVAPNAYSFDMTFVVLPKFEFTLQDSPTDRFQFQATSGAKLGFNFSNTNFLNVVYQGTFHDLGGFYSDAAASLSLSFNQTGGNSGTVAYSGTFATPPSNSIPEPATMGLFGSALVCLGMIRRKRIAR